MHSKDPESWPAKPATGTAPPRAARTFQASILVLLAALALAAPHLAAGGEVWTAAVPLVLFAGIALISARGFQQSYPFERMGACNFVTLTRAALAALLCVPILSRGAMEADGYAWGILALGVACLALDGLDGWLARRSGLASEFGGRFDVEVDAVFAALLALLVWQTGKAGAWVLALGTMRYGFLAAAAFAPWLGHPLPESPRRKTICVIQIGTLILLLAPVLVPPVSVWLAAAMTLLLAWSFAVDIRRLWQMRA